MNPIALSRLWLPVVCALLLTLAAAAFFLRAGASAQEEGPLVVTGWARATPPGAGVGAAYLRIENRGGSPDRLVAADSPAAARVEFHQTVETDGVASMRPAADIPIAAGESVDMAPGGLHIMLVGLTAPLREGDTLRLSLDFAGAGRLEAELAVAAIGAAGPEPHGHSGR